MPYSLEDQLRLFDPRRFEELCAQLVKVEELDSWRVEGRGGDEGIDIFAGEIDKGVRAKGGGELRVWQVKFFRDGVRAGQRRQAEKSLERVIEEHEPEQWTLCVPVNLDVNAQKWFQSLKTRYPRRRIKVWQADEIVRRVLQDESVIGGYFLREQECIAQKELGRIVERLDDFESASELLKLGWEKEKGPADFYSGTIPSWSDIAGDYDAPREQIGQLWEFIAERASCVGGRVPFGLITGRSGDGKSTLLMRLGTELVRQGCGLVFFCKDDVQLLRADQVSELPTDKTCFLFIDKIGRFEVGNLRGFFERIYRKSLPVVVIGAEVRSLWEGLDVSMEDVADIFEVGLERMTDRDIEALVDKLGADKEHAVEYLGRLADLSRAQQITVFRQRAEGQLLVALMEAKHDRAFKAYVYEELRKLGDRFGSGILRVCRYVSGVHRLDLGMPREVLQRLCPNICVDEMLRRSHGLLAELLAKGTNVITRHALVADVIFDSEENKKRRYEEIIRAAHAEHERLIARMLHRIALGGEHALAHELFRVASQHCSKGVVFLQMHGMLAWKEGDVEQARGLFKKAVEVDAGDGPSWQAWAVMEKKQGDVEMARRLFKKAVEADPAHGASWQAWAVMEKGEGNIEEANVLFKKAVEVDPGNGPAWQAWAIMQKEQGDIQGARRLFKEAVEADPRNAPSWQAWAVMEGEQNNIGSIQKEYTARWLFKKASEVEGRMVYTWQAWALMEKKQGNIERAKELFKKAVEVDPSHAPAWQAWAVMEGEQKNVGSFEEEYSARWLFRKASQVDPKMVHTWHGWALMEKGEGDIEGARKLFEKGVKLNPGDAAMSWQAWAVMEKEQGHMEEAKLLFKRAVEVDPRNGPSWQAWALMEKEAGDTEHARELLKKAVEADPRSVASWQAWAIMEKEQGHIKRARELFKKALEADPRNALAWQAWGVMEKEQGNVKEARSLFKKALEANPRNGPALQAWAVMEKEQGDIEQARKLFRKAVEGDVGHALSWQAWAVMEGEQNNIGSIQKEYTARWLFKKASEVEGRMVYTWQAWALMEKKQGNIERAKELFKKAVEVDPSHAPGWQAWAIMEKEQGHIEQATKLFKNAVDADPSNAPSWQAWAIMEKEQGDIQQARKLFKKAVDADPRNGPSWQAWAVMEGEQKNIGCLDKEYSARWLFKKASEVDRRMVHTWQAWGVMEGRQKNIGSLDKEYSARWLFKKAGEVDPKVAHTWWAWAAMEKEEGNWAEAERLYLKAADVEQDRKLRGRIYSDVAMMIGFRNVPQKKEEYLLLAAGCDPNDSFVQAQLGRTYGFQKRWGESEKHFQRALELDGGNQKAREWYDRMQKARERDRMNCIALRTRPEGGAKHNENPPNQSTG